MIVILLAGIVAAALALPLIVAGIVSILPVHRMVGSAASDPQFLLRVRVVRSFLTGLRDGMLQRTSAPEDLDLKSFEVSFWIEGAWAGLVLASHMPPWTGRRKLAEFKTIYQRYVFLLVIGHGFAHGLATVWTSSLMNIERAYPVGVDPRLRHLFFDGFGFQRFIVHYRRRPALLRAGLELPANVAGGFYTGAGRALWFLLPSPQAFLSIVSTLPESAASHCITGYGIASGFAGCEGIAQGLLWSYPAQLQASIDFRLGFEIGLFARHYSDPGFLETVLAHTPNLANRVRTVATLYDDMWGQGCGYEEWAKALRSNMDADAEFGYGTVVTSAAAAS